jgi:carbon storage regulator
MLVLSRRVGESLVIGDDVVITILEMRGDVVRVGVDAPRSVQVHRQELLTEVAETNRAAASPGADAVAKLSRRVAPRPAQEPSTDPDAPSSSSD